MTRTNLPSTIWVCVKSKVDEKGLWLKSMETSGSSQMPKTPFSAPLAAYLKDDLWLDNARHANHMALRLADGLSAVDGIELCRPPSGNQLFMAMDPALKTRLFDAGAYFHDWPDDGPTAVRMVTAFNTLEADVDAVIAAANA